MCFSEIREVLDHLMYIYGVALYECTGYDQADKVRSEMVSIAHCACKLGVLSPKDFNTIVRVIWNAKAFRRLSMPSRLVAVTTNNG